MARWVGWVCWVILESGIIQSEVVIPGKIIYDELFQYSKQLSAKILKQIKKGQFSECKIIYTSYKSAIIQMTAVNILVINLNTNIIHATEIYIADPITRR